MMMIVRYPFTAPTNAKPIPWLPLVGSTIIESERINPRRSASSIIFNAVRVLMEPPTFNASNFTRTSAAPGGTIRCNRTSGVFPTASKTVSQIIVSLTS